MKKWLLGGLALAVIGGGLFIFVLHDQAEAPKSDINQAQPVANDQEPINQFDKEEFSLENPESIWVIVNKKRALPAGYAPTDLIVPGVHLRLAPSEEQMHIRKGVEGDLKAMFDAAKKDGIDLVFGSGYRSEAQQKSFYDSYTAKDGQAAADTYSARPGHSEHQTGLAFDLSTANGNCHLQICYADTPDGQWVAKHAAEYGFIIRYQKGKEAITGYQYEPWHLRYVGTALAAQIQNSSQTLEEFFEVGSAPQY